MIAEQDYEEMTAIQEHWNRLWRDKHRWIIVDEGNGKFTIHEHKIDGVYPPCEKDNIRDVASRLLQLFDIGPVAPQDYPERVCVGEIEYEPAEILPLTKAIAPSSTKR